MLKISKKYVYDSTPKQKQIPQKHLKPLIVCSPSIHLPSGFSARNMF